MSGVGSGSGRVGSGQFGVQSGRVGSGAPSLGKWNLEGQWALGERNLWASKNSTSGKQKRKTEAENTNESTL